MAGLGGLLGKLTAYLSRSLFLYGLTCLRMGSTLLALAHTLLAVYITVHSPLRGSLLAVVLAAVYAASGMPLLPAYAALVAAIPAAWMAATNLVFTHSPTASLTVFLRAEAGALHALYILHASNPSELSTLLSRLGARRAALAVQLFWRVPAQLLRESSEMLQVHSLKRVETWKSLAMVFVRGEEVSLLYGDGLILKEHTFKPRPLISARCVLVQAALVACDVLALLLP